MSMKMIDSYKDLPIGKFIEIQDICKEEMTELERQSAILGVLTDTSEDEVMLLPIMEYRDLAVKSRFLEREPIVNKRIGKEYKLGNWSLIPCVDIRKMTTAQYTDFLELQKQQDIVLLLSCLLVPKGNRYNEGYDIVELQRDLREMMPTPDALALSAFFLNSWKASIRTILIYCKWEARRMKDKEKRKETMEAVRRTMEALRRLGVG